jgi:hypothetical protein
LDTKNGIWCEVPTPNVSSIQDTKYFVFLLFVNFFLRYWNSSKSGKRNEEKKIWRKLPIASAINAFRNESNAKYFSKNGVEDFQKCSSL